MSASIRHRLLLVVLPALLAVMALLAWIAFGAADPGQHLDPAVAAVAAVLLLACAAATVAAARHITRPLAALQDNARQLQTGLVPRARTDSSGIRECDEVLAALAVAAEATADARADLQRQVGDAVARTRAVEQRAATRQRTEALGRLTGGVAHDFNNLLGIISNSAHLVQRQATSDDEQAALAAILRAVDSGSRLTQHLLRFAGLRAVRPTQFDPARYLPELRELLRSVLGSRVALSIAVVPGTRSVTADLNELELALLNLALNARDALPQGGHVELRAANADPTDTDGLPPAPYVRITFSDDGIGLEPQHAEHAFEPFFTTKPVDAGNGLGLTQVHSFCVQAGGSARLGSTPGLGTTVSLVLPASSGVAATAAQPGPPAATAAPAAASTPGPSLAGSCILLVDDNRELSAVTAALLVSFGCRVRRAANAEAALALLQAHGDIDAVLSDIVMPGAIDGLALARRLRAERPQLPLLLMSGYSAAAAKAVDFAVLQKPYAQQQLVSALQAALVAAPPGHVEAPMRAEAAGLLTANAPPARQARTVARC